MNKFLERLPVVAVMVINVVLLASLYVNLTQALKVPIS